MRPRETGDLLIGRGENPQAGEKDRCPVPF